MGASTVPRLLAADSDFWKVMQVFGPKVTTVGDEFVGRAHRSGASWRRGSCRAHHGVELVGRLVEVL